MTAGAALVAVVCGMKSSRFVGLPVLIQIKEALSALANLTWFESKRGADNA